jgi:hypothetical protein
MILLENYKKNRKEYIKIRENFLKGNIYSNKIETDKFKELIMNNFEFGFKILGFITDIDKIIRKIDDYAADVKLWEETQKDYHYGVLVGLIHGFKTLIEEKYKPFIQYE